MLAIVKGFSPRQALYTQEQLEAAFNKVKNPRGWKEHIAITLHDQTEADIAAIEEAVPYFTGGPANARPLKKKGSYRITASGYYMCVGA